MRRKRGLRRGTRRLLPIAEDLQETNERIGRIALPGRTRLANACELNCVARDSREHGVRDLLVEAPARAVASRHTALVRLAAEGTALRVDQMFFGSSVQRRCCPVLARDVLTR